MLRDAGYWIAALGLTPHPEGGHYRESWRAAECIAAAGLPGRFAGPRALGTAIYYLLAAGESSRLHRLRADEVWHLLDGGPLSLHLLDSGGGRRTLALAHEAGPDRSPQQVVPHGSWFAAEVDPGTSFALVSCTVTPGFEFEDFELGDRAALLEAHPQHAGFIRRFTEG